MRQANFLWGAPRIHGELLKLGIEVAPSTVGKYLRRHRKPPSQTWRTFLKNHVQQMASMDFFTVPTATFRVLFVFIVLSHDRPAHRALQRHGTPNRKVDHTADSRGVSMGRSTAVSDPRSGCDLRKGHRRNHQRDGHRRSGYRAAIAMAKSVCGAADRIHSPGVPGSHHRVEREIVASDSAPLFSLLRALAHAFSIGQRCASAQSRGPAKRTAVSLPFLRWAACTIDTNDALPNL